MSEILKLNSKLDEHLKAIKGGANWFYWIAGLSIINTLIIFFNGDVNFIVGLGLTQIIDAIFYDSPNGLLFLYVQDYLGVGFHAFVLFMIVGGFGNIKLAEEVESKIEEESLK